LRSAIAATISGPGETLKQQPSAPEGHGTMSNRSRNGFSLVELLVVIAVVAMLTCLLTFAIHKMRRFAQRAHDSGNAPHLALSCHDSPAAVWTAGEGSSPASPISFGSDEE
jgi:prepilin-type N-terminal cleavage/methylation domain-containing protein